MADLRPPQSTVATHDFSQSTSALDNTPRSHLHFTTDERTRSSPPHAESPGSSTSLPRRNTIAGVVDGNGSSPILQRRGTRRISTARTYRAASKAYQIRPLWQPGQEPGLDVLKDNGGRVGAAGGPVNLHEECDITVVDFSKDDMVMRRLDNAGLANWLDSEQERASKGEFGRDESGHLRRREEWVKCRWISVNGLSWDVIRCLGKWKKLHRLALEDLANTRSRTKVDWYEDHTFMVLTLQKLVHLHPDGSEEDDDDSDAGSNISIGGSKKRGLVAKIKEFFNGPAGLDSSAEEGEVHDPSYKYVSAHTSGEPGARIQKLRTLQRYHGGPNHERAIFMEAHSALTAKDLAVCAEQVSIFLCDDNTVISFCQSSAEDLENPILTRLSTPDTILRRSCDASMLMQSLIDAIIDLSILVTTAYQDVIGDLELDILTEPSIKHTTRLYIVSSEIASMRSFISPIATLVNALRDHKPDAVANSVNYTTHPGSSSAVKISSMAHTYLGDVEDHIVSILSSLDQMAQSSNHLIDLIFNTISAYQNESMKQLTIVTIFFLPMTFITGYFGMNLTTFPSLNTISEDAFWAITAPVVFAVMLFLMRDKLSRWGRTTVLRRGISRRRQGRLERERERKGK